MASKASNVVPLRAVPSASPGGEPTHRPERRPTLEDAEILAAVRAGDVSAAAAFHDRVRPTVDRVVHRMLRSTDPDREDATQNVLIVLVTSVDRYRGEGPLDAWVSRVAAHVVLKHLRRRRLEGRTFDGAYEVEHAGSARALGPERRVTMRSALDRVKALLGRLDPLKAWTFLLHDVHGYDLKEIAEITEVSVAAAQGRLSRGRRELHAMIGAEPGLEEFLEEIEAKP